MRPTRIPKPIAWLTGAALLVTSAGPVLAQTDPAPADAPPAEGAPASDGERKPLAGKGGFNIDDFEDSQFDERARKIQASMSERRQQKAKMLESLVNSNRPTPKMADYIFRLAETKFEEAKYQYLLSRQKYNDCLDQFERGLVTEECGEPKEDYTEALDLYRKVLREHPSYRRIDEVMYHLGKAALKAGKDRRDTQLSKEGVKRLNDLVQKYPKSRYIAQTHLALGEHFFDTDSLFYAKTNYEKIIRNYPKSPMFNYALYKLGWVYFNLTEFEKTIDTFKKVVEALEGSGSDGVISFKKQALNDLVVTWAEIDNGWRDAREYFLDKVGEEDTYKKLDKMAGLLVSKDKDDEAVDLYNHLIDHEPVGVKVVEYLDAILEVRRKIGAMGETEAEINRVVNYFDHKGKWWIANNGQDEVRDRADDLVATNLIFLANHFHRGAQKLDDQKKKREASPMYGKAANYYSMFLVRFPDHKDSYVFSFYYAEILYDELEDFAEAATQYEKVIQRDTRGEYMEDAALGVIYAVEKLMVAEGIREKVDGNKVVYEKKGEDDKVALDKGELKPIPKTDLHQLEQRYVAAADKYVELLRDALKDDAFRKKYPNRGKMIPEIMFIAAQTFYQHGQFRQAVERLMVIFDLYPEHRMANVAVNTIIDAYARLKRWEKIEGWARKLIAARNFKVKTKAELEAMIGIAKTEHARDLTKQRKFDEAIRVQQEIVDEFGRKNKKLASIALYNIGIIHETARRFPEAVETFESVVKRYPKESVAVNAQFEIGVLYESQTRFTEAAEAFIKMEKFKKEAPDKAQDAVKNAALIFEAMEQYDEANKTFLKYLKLFPDAEDAKAVAFHAAEVLEFKKDTKAYVAAAKQYDAVAKKHGRKDAQYKMRALAASGRALKLADKVKNRKKVVKKFKDALKIWNKVSAAGDTEASTKAYAGMAALELAEYAYDDYAKLSIDAIDRRGNFSVRILKSTLVAKAEALGKAGEAFSKVLDFKDPGIAAASSFRLGQLYYEFAQNLFNAPVPPQLTDEMDIDEYRFQLEEVAAPIEEKALSAFTLALKQAIEKNVYNKWSRLSAEYAAKVNKDEFPVSVFNGKPNKTKDTLQSTSFIQVIREGDVVVDFSE